MSGDLLALGMKEEFNNCVRTGKSGQCDVRKE